MTLDALRLPDCARWFLLTITVGGSVVVLASACADASSSAATAGDAGPSNVEARDSEAPPIDASDAGSSADADAAPVDPNAIVKIATGGYHSCALLGSGKVWCWGNNMVGQLGLGSADSQGHFTAAMVPGISDAVDIALGGATTCVVTSAGKARCWGLNSFRQLAVGPAGDASCSWHGAARPCRLTPVDLPLTGTIVKLAPGWGHSCALVAQGGVSQVWCWGLNDGGQLGHDSSTDDTCTVGQASVRCNAMPSTVAVSGPIDLTSGDAHNVAVGSGGAVMVWGWNYSGVLGTGIGDKAAHPAPTVVANVQAASLLPAGGSADHVCVRTTAGNLSCWGSNISGQCGQAAPGAVAPALVSVSFTSGGLGVSHTCVLTPAKTVQCWGDNVNGQLGRDPSDAGEPIPAPNDVPGLSSVKAISVGGYNTCALKDDNTVWCWGRNKHGEAGLDPSSGLDVWAPNQVIGIGK